MKSRRLTRGKAIRTFCLICYGWTGYRDGNGSPVSKREASRLVRECEDEQCPLHPYRSGHEEKHF